MKSREEIRINISEGGNGDMWMRLISFYAASQLFPHIGFSVYLPGFMRTLADHTFGDRLTFISDGESCEFFFTSLGLKHMAAGLRSGRKYIAPYHRSVMLDKGKRTMKDRVNIALFNTAQALGKIHLPPWEIVDDYQGYMDIIGLKPIRSMAYETYRQQLHVDYTAIKKRLEQDKLPLSPELNIPEDIGERLLVFPNGTSRQFIPTWWAKQYLPDAYYAFFIRDTYAEEFLAAGLQVVYYYKEPGDMLALSHAAHWTVSTDSFSSHLLQSATQRCTITTTEVLASRIISPVYKGEVVDAVAPCHPCLKMERNAHPTCMAGYTDCLNWKSEVYSRNILLSIPGR